MALRLVELAEVVNSDSIEETWTDEISARVDEIISGEATGIPLEEVLARLTKRRAARHSTHQQA